MNRPFTHRLPCVLVCAALALAGPRPLLAGPAAEREKPSLHDLELELTDQDGRVIDLDVHSGQPSVISMFYATCPHACPALIADIKRLDAALGEGAREQTRYLLVSLDPEDSLDTFRGLIEMHSLDPKRWRLTKTDAAGVRRLAAVLGVKYRKLPDGSWNHSSIVTVLDREGRVAYSAEGLGLEHAGAIEALQRIADENDD